MGDTEGNLFQLKPRDHYKNNSIFENLKWNTSSHRLTIIQILAIEKENTLFTIGYDQKIVAYEALSGK